MNQNELMHYGVLGMKWGVHRGAKQLQRSLNRLEKKRVRQVAINMEMSTKKRKTEKSETKRQDSERAIREIARRQRRLIRRHGSKKYETITKDKLMDGRSFVRKIAMSGAIPTAIDAAFLVSKYDNKYPTKFRGRDFNQNPMQIKGVKYKVKSRNYY